MFILYNLAFYKSKSILMKKSAILLIAILAMASCKNTADEAGVTENSKQATIDSMNAVIENQKIELARQQAIDSMKAVAAANEARTKTVYVNNNTPAAAKKKGWSNTAKGAVIGAGVGAITGAAVSKKKGEGAIIGGLGGAAVGAGTGAIIDSEKKKKEQQ
jgi:hypothetical protein